MFAEENKCKMNGFLLQRQELKAPKIAGRVNSTSRLQDISCSRPQMQPADPLNSSTTCQSLQGSRQNYAHSLQSDEQWQRDGPSAARTVAQHNPCTTGPLVKKKKKRKKSVCSQRLKIAWGGKSGGRPPRAGRDRTFQERRLCRLALS